MCIRDSCRTAPALPELERSACWAEGEAMTLEHALDTALAPPPRRERPGRDAAPDGLTPREVEVLGLVAAGRSNQEIAAALGLSGRTVERHLARVYDKLGLRGKAARAAAAAYVAGHRLTAPPPSRAAAR